METRKFTDLVFRHMVELPGFDCVFCSTQDRSSGRTRLYLVFNHQDKIYCRNGLKGTWMKVKDTNEYETIRTRFNAALEDHSVPCYSA